MSNQIFIHQVTLNKHKMHKEFDLMLALNQALKKVLFVRVCVCELVGGWGFVCTALSPLR
jgi:hypothetical protein